MAKGAIMTAFSQTANVVVANVTAERTVTGLGIGSLTFPAMYLEPGTSLRILLRGVWSTSGSPTLRWRAKLGGTVLLDTGAVQEPKDAPNEPWAMEVMLVCRSAGAQGAIIGAGSVASISTHIDFPPQTTPVAIDTTRPLALDVTCQWGTAAAGNTVTCTHLLIWAEQPI
jgi:hypothetical protein